MQLMNLKLLKETIEKQSGKCIKVLCLEKEIFVQMILMYFVSKWAFKYTPQQHGVVEIRNKPIIDMARCMFESREKPDKQ
jgi:hypothetical protein